MMRSVWCMPSAISKYFIISKKIGQHQIVIAVNFQQSLVSLIKKIFAYKPRNKFTAKTMKRRKAAFKNLPWVYFSFLILSFPIKEAAHIVINNFLMCVGQLATDFNSTVGYFQTYNFYFSKEYLLSVFHKCLFVTN